MKFIHRHLGLILLVGISIFLMLYRLDNTQLAPWDEAWYATIARNIFRSGDIFNLSYNGKVFWDHPPLAFALMSLSYALFGVSELTSRLPEAVAGVLAVALTYLTAKKMSGDKRIGTIAGLILLSSRWFLMRSRTANLEALLLLSQLGIFYFSVTAKKYRDLTPLWVVFGLSLMIKSVISITLFPLVAVATLLVIRKEKKIKLGFVIPFAILAFPWYLVNYLHYGWPFLQRNIFETALRSKGGFKTGVKELTQTLLYYRSSVHKWYWPSIFSSLWGIIRIGDVNYRWLLMYLAVTTIPYFASPRTEIWHLLPMLPAAALLSGYSIKSISEIVPIKIREWFLWSSLVFVIAISGSSLKSYWPSLYHDYSGAFEAQLALSSKGYSYPLYLQDTTYVPTVVFYADAPVNLIWDDKNLVNTLKRPFQIITREHMLLDAKDFMVADKAGDTVLAIFE